jgi:predicted site-specific integrase-resolvase
MKRLITQKEAAEILGICPKTLWEWSNRGLIPQVRLPGTRVKYDIKDIEQLIKINKSSDLPFNFDRVF